MPDRELRPADRAALDNLLRSPEVALLRALLSDHHGVDMSTRPPTYVKPTLTTHCTVQAGATIAQRSDYCIVFVFTEPDSTRVFYECEISQDDLFRALHAHGHLTRRVTP